MRWSFSLSLLHSLSSPGAEADLGMVIQREFCDIDMTTTSSMLRVVKYFFPSFEFTWLGEEMEANLPLEMDFRHEAANAARAAAGHAGLKRTTLVVPEVKWARKRVMVMECELVSLGVGAEAETGGMGGPS